MSQWLLVYVIIAISVIYILYKVWQSFHQKQRVGCTGYCSGCPFATDAIRKRYAPYRKNAKEIKEEKNISKKEAKNLED